MQVVFSSMKKRKLFCKSEVIVTNGDFFGGLVELGESLEEAAIREVKEESGYNVEITSLYGIYSKYFAIYSNGDEAQTVCTLFRAKIVFSK